MYGATATRSQSQTHIRLRPPFRTVWSVGLGGLIEFPAVVDDGVAYIGNARARIYAVSMRFGKVIWRHDTPNGKMASSPAVVGEERRLPHDGRPRVRARPGVGSSCSGSTTSARRSSRRRSSGAASTTSAPGTGDSTHSTCARIRLRWTRSLGAKITSSAAIAGSTLYIGDYGGRVWAIAAATGRTRWVRSVNGRVYGTPAVLDGRVFVPSSTGGSLTAFSTGGRYLWRVGTGAYVYSSPAAWGGRVFFGSYNGVFYAVSAVTRDRSCGRSARAARSQERRSSSTESRTPAASRITSSASTREAAACSSVSRMDTTFRSPGTACAYFSTGIHVSMQWSRGPSASRTANHTDTAP